MGNTLVAYRVKLNKRYMSINLFSVMIYILSSVFLISFDSAGKFVYVIQFFCLLICLLNNVLKNGKISISKIALFVFALFCFITVYLFYSSEYSQFYLIKTFVPLCIMYFWIHDGIGSCSRRLEKLLWLIFYLLFLIDSMYTLLSATDSVLFPSLFQDVNFRDFITALFLIYSFQKKRYSSFCVLFLIRFLSHFGRGFLLFMILYLVLQLVRDRNSRISYTIVRFLKTRLFIFFFIIISVLLLSIFSFYWVDIMCQRGVVGYKEGLNDMSNLQRFNANVYAVEQLFGTKNFIFGGYGGELHTQVFGYEVQKIRYNDIILVQPHCAVLNLLMCLGIVPGILYLLVFSSVLRKVITVDNFMIVIPFLIYSLILWIYPNNGLEMFVVFLMLLSRKRSIRI